MGQSPVLGLERAQFVRHYQPLAVRVKEARQLQEDKAALRAQTEIEAEPVLQNRQVRSHSPSV